MKNNGIKTGAVVTFTAKSCELFTSRDSNVLYDVTDSRHVGGGHYVFSLTPITEPPTLNAAYTDVDPDDLKIYR